MTLQGIISISGRPGLFKVLAQGKNNIIVESLTDKKRFPAYATDRISALEDISIYTYGEDKPLTEVFEAIYEKQGGKEALSHKESANKLQEYILEVLPDLDQERVYPSDVKKIFQWYNLLIKADLLKPEESKEENKEDSAEKEVPKKKPAAKKAPAKKTANNKETAAKKPAAKKAPAKKTTTKKSTSSEK